MITTLIERTNTREFYQDSDLKLMSLNRKNNGNCDFLFSINQISYDIPIEYEEWIISCENVRTVQGFNNELLLPYVKMALIENHPLLWSENENDIECLIEGFPKNINSLIGDLHLCLEKNTGNWITVKDFFWGVEDRFNCQDGTRIAVSKSLLNFIKPVFEKHGLKLTIINDNCYNRDIAELPLRLLMFGNTDVSPNEFSLAQHYIIAENFAGERTK
jgi:hypothetical protein